MREGWQGTNAKNWRQRTLSSSLALRMLSSLAFSVMSRRASLLAEGVDMVA